MLKLCTQARSLILSIPWLRLLGTSTYSRTNPAADFGQFGEALGYMRQLRNFELTRAVEKGAEENTVSLDVLCACLRSAVSSNLTWTVDVLLDRSFPELEYLKFSAKRFHPLTFVPQRQLVLKKFKFSQKFPHDVSQDWMLEYCSRVEVSLIGRARFWRCSVACLQLPSLNSPSRQHQPTFTTLE